VAIALSDLRFVASVYLVGILNRRSDNTMATRDRRDKQKQQIEGQTIQWPQDTDEINRSYKSKVTSICSFCLSLRYRVAIALSDLRFVASVYLVGILWPLYCLTFGPQDTDKINRSNKSKVRHYNGLKILRIENGCAIRTIVSYTAVSPCG
jgi:uncharacterized protein YpmS